MDGQNLVELISSVGFPVVMVGWFAFRNEKNMKENTIATTEVTKVLSLLLKQLEHEEMMERSDEQ